MVWYAVRMTVPHRYVDDILRFLRVKVPVAHALCQETGFKTKQEHYHILAYTPHTIDTLRNHIKDFIKQLMNVEVVGNKYYNIKTVHDLNGALRYLMKSDTDFYLYNPFGTTVYDDVVKAHEYAVNFPWVWNKTLDELLKELYDDPRSQYYDDLYSRIWQIFIDCNKKVTFAKLDSHYIMIRSKDPQWMAAQARVRTRLIENRF